MKKTVATRYQHDEISFFGVDIRENGEISIITPEYFRGNETLKALHKFLGEVLLDLGEEPAIIKKPEPIVEKAEMKRQYIADDTGIL